MCSTLWFSLLYSVVVKKQRSTGAFETVPLEGGGQGGLVPQNTGGLEEVNESKY